MTTTDAAQGTLVLGVPHAASAAAVVSVSSLAAAGVQSDLDAVQTLAEMVREVERFRAQFEGHRRSLLSATLDEVVARMGADGVREAASVIACEIGQSDVVVERWLSDAWATVNRLPLTHAAQREGRLSPAHVRAIEAAMRPLAGVDGGAMSDGTVSDGAVPDDTVPDDTESDPATIDGALTEERRREVEARLVDLGESTTPARLRRRARRIVDAAVGDALTRRHRIARDERGVWLSPADDGMCDLTARVPAVVGVAIMDRLTQGARAKSGDDPRTFDQWRADAFAALLLAGEVDDDVEACQRINAVVTVNVSATALINGSSADVPAHIDGGVLVDDDTVRAIAGDAPTWDRLLLHPTTGVPLTVDTYRPTVAQRTWLRARDGRCRWPGCAANAHRSDLDHTVDHARGGGTSLDNLAHLGRHHHTLKHASRWRVRQRDDGDLEWTSPTGRIVVDEPEWREHERERGRPRFVASPSG